MDTGPDELTGPAPVGMVNVATAFAAQVPAWGRRLVATLLIALVATALLAAVAGGLIRAGVALGMSPTVLLGQATLFHAALMLSGFLGTVIGVERAVALKWPAAFGAPIASGLASALLLAGLTTLAAAALEFAALLFVAVNVRIVRRQPAAHTALLLFAALAWLIGNTLFLVGSRDLPAMTWWFGFVVATIAAERLEMTRLMPRHAAAQPPLFGLLALGALGAILTATAWLVTGGVLFGFALTGLALWFGAFDIARRTLFTQGLSRYMAVCLLSGYAWLAVAGVAWIAMALGYPTRDVALHALGLGFIISMVMGHALVILPAVTGIKVDFNNAFYVPLLLLHASLIVRLALSSRHAAGAALNAAALALFAVTMLVSALRRRARQSPRPSGSP